MYYLLGCFSNSSELKIKSIWQYTVDIKLRVLRSSTSYKGKKNSLSSAERYSVCMSCPTCVGLWTGLTGGVPGLPDHRTAALFAGQVTRQGVLTDVLWWAGPSGCIVGRITVAFPHI